MFFYRRSVLVFAKNRLFLGGGSRGDAGGFTTHPHKANFYTGPLNPKIFLNFPSFFQPFWRKSVIQPIGNFRRSMPRTKLLRHYFTLNFIGETGFKIFWTFSEKKFSWFQKSHFLTVEAVFRTKSWFQKILFPYRRGHFEQKTRRNFFQSKNSKEEKNSGEFTLNTDSTVHVHYCTCKMCPNYVEFFFFIFWTGKNSDVLKLFFLDTSQKI